MTLEIKLIKTLEYPEGIVNIYENGFVESFINEDAHLDVPYLIKEKKELEALGLNKKFYVLSEPVGFYRITKEARDLSATKEYGSHLAAVAIVTDHVAERLVIDVYNKINKPVVPTKVFRERGLAKEWLMIRWNKAAIENFQALFL